MNGITGELIDAKKLRTTLAAKRGTFDSKANILELFDAIDVAGDAGMKAKLTRATIDTKENIITSREAVMVMMDAGKPMASRALSMWAVASPKAAPGARLKETVTACS